MTTTPIKNSLIAKIHIAKKQLDMDEDDYRAFLVRVAGKPSCSELSPQKLKAVLDEMKKLGFKPATKTKRIGTRKLNDAPQAKMIRALWLTLRDMGALTDSSEAALLAFVKRMTGADAFEWLDSKQTNTVINALRGWIEREEEKNDD